MALTKQQYYDLLARSASDGTFPSRNDAGVCLYRGPNGKKCAVGIIIPDELYKPDFDNCSNKAFSTIITSLIVHYPQLEHVIPDGMSADDLRQIQAVHDMYSGWDSKRFIQRINQLECFKDVTHDNVL